MGEKQNQPFQLSFSASLKVDFQGSRVTSDLPAAGRRCPDPSAGVGRTSGIQRTHPATLEGLSGEEHPVAPR